MPRFELVLLVTGIDPEDSDKMEVLLDVAEESYLSRCDGQVRLTTFLEHSSITRAVTELVLSLQARIPGFIAERAELKLVTIPDIANIVGLNRESVRLWTTGRRGPGDFPVPFSAVSDGRMKVWAFSDVEKWLRRQGFNAGAHVKLSPDEIADVNRSLECVRIASLPVVVASATPWQESGGRRELRMDIMRVPACA